MNQTESKNVKRRRGGNRGKGSGATSEKTSSEPIESSTTSNGFYAKSSDKGKTTAVGPGEINSLLEDTKININRIYRDVLDSVGENFHFKSRPSKGEIFSTPTVVLYVAQQVVGLC